MVPRSFSAADRMGGCHRGDGEEYGRPWVAVDGARSEFPRATITFTLVAVPVEDVILIKLAI